MLACPSVMESCSIGAWPSWANRAKLLLRSCGRKTDGVDDLSGKASSRNFGALCDLSKQSPRHDGTGSAPLIHRRLGPYWNRYGSNPAVLADQIGDDPPVLDNAKLLHRNRRDLSAPKATAEQDRKDGAVPLTPN